MTITTTPAGVRPGRRVRRTVLLTLLTLPGLVWAVFRSLGWEPGYVVMVMAFTPYVAAWTLVPLIAALLARKWLIAAAAALAAILLGAAVLPRALPDKEGESGVPLTVMTLNTFFGRADPAAVVKLVREHDVEVLAVQEFTPKAAEGLAAAGLGDLLPYKALADEVGTTGSGLYSKYPMTGAGSQRFNGDNLQEGNMQAYATIQPPGAAAITVESAHPLAPYSKEALPSWKADLEQEPRPARSGTPRILLGDFNSTLDHAPLRDLIADGYRDAADAAGKGLIGTWGPYDGKPIPPVTLDHVLVDERMGVRDVQVHGVDGSDHRSVIAFVTVPAAQA
ncbi:endonuclease/exonuclease/phosphatase family protein [Actinoplanes sp. NPDC049596]|uniref:endonuclease/exonuclease/phosphatase family protein n=1 Tax=unclassified Actinoplanes TaxID=2626549 RepID=UPI003427BEEF